MTNNPSLENAFFKQILESIEDYAVFTTNVEGNITSWNAGAENVLGYAEQEILGKHASIIFTAEDIESNAPDREASEALAKGRGVDERYHQRKNGTVFWGSGLVFPLYDEQQQHIGFTKIMRNLSNRKEAEDKLLEARRYAESIVETSKEAMLIVDIDLSLNSASPAFYALFDIMESAAKGMLLYDALGSRMNTQLLKEQMQRYDSFENLELPFLKEGAEEAGVLLVSCRKVFRTFNSIGQFLLTFEDVTSHRRVEQAKEDFISVASHELKTPVTIIRSYIQILDMELRGTVNDNVKYTLDRILHQSDMLNKLTSYLLDASEFKTGTIQLKKESFVLMELLMEIVKETFDHNTAHKIVIGHTVECSVFADRNRLAQVVTNLLANAVKYSPKGGTIRISMCRDDGTGHVRVEITDEGIGIDEHKKDDLFKRFSRITDGKSSGIKGFGMGLYISSEIMKAHNGAIGVFNNTGPGATFFFDFPLQ